MPDPATPEADLTHDFISPRGVDLGGVVRLLAQALARAGVSEPALDARLLVMRACGLSHAELISKSSRMLDEAAALRLAQLAARRLAREPMARILGFREFWGRDFAIGPATLEPRPDTETLVEAVLNAVHSSGRGEDRLRILDIGTGSGCILISLLCELPEARGLGTDIAPEALDVAQANATRHGLGARCGFVLTSWLSGIAGTFDLIVANPPYIASSDLGALAPEVLRHDPLAALDGGADGLGAYRAIIPDLSSRLAPGGLVALEVGLGQAAAVRAMLRQAGHDGTSVQVLRDLAGVERVVLAAAFNRA
jgi:release factor glutamine methyltransferase